MVLRVILYMGAPDNDNINWNAAYLVSNLDPALLYLVAKEEKERAGTCSRQNQGLAKTIITSSTSSVSAWRYLPRKQAHLRTSFSQLQHFNYPSGDAVFFSSATAMSFSHHHHSGTRCGQDHFDSDTEARDDETTKYHCHSLANRESQPRELSLATADSLLADEDASSCIPDGDGLSEPSLVEPLGNASYAITSLADIPSSGVITAFCAASVTVNLIVAIISIAPPFTVRTRWGSRDVVELVVGDETRSGFSITFWLTDAYRAALASLRRQDVVLLRNVALSSFKRAVHGNSLRGDLTKPLLLFRTKLHPSGISGHYRRADIVSSKPAHPQLEKTRKVREWVLRFVGPAPASPYKQNSAAATVWDQPPEDSQ